MIKHDDKDK